VNNFVFGDGHAQGVSQAEFQGMGSTQRANFAGVDLQIPG